MLTPRLDKVFIYTCNGKYKIKHIRRFLKYVKVNRETGCWEWIGNIEGKFGYGRFHVRSNGRFKSYSAHRMAYELYYNKLIPEGMCILHKCDNPKCVNVLACLFLGTIQDNIKDMDSKGRRANSHGEGNSNAKITWNQVNEIRRLYATGQFTYKQLVKIFNITIASISLIILNKNWHDPNYLRIERRNNLATATLLL